MNDFKESSACYRLLMEHPVPWKYISGKGDSPSRIVDADDREVVAEVDVSSVIFSAIWAMYFHLLRE